MGGGCEGSVAVGASWIDANTASIAVMMVVIRRCGGCRACGEARRLTVLLRRLAVAGGMTRGLHFLIRTYKLRLRRRDHARRQPIPLWGVLVKLLLAGAVVVALHVLIVAPVLP